MGLGSLGNGVFLRVAPLQVTDDRQAQEDGIERRRRHQVSRVEQANREDIDDDPQQPAFDMAAGHQELCGDTERGNGGIPSRRVGVGVGGHQPANQQPCSGGDRQVKREGQLPERCHADAAIVGPTLQPNPEAVKLDDEEVHLEEGVAIELIVPENEEVERDHHEAERVVPNRAPNDERDVDQTASHRNPFDKRPAHHAEEKLCHTRIRLNGFGWLSPVTLMRDGEVGNGDRSAAG